MEGGGGWGWGGGGGGWGCLTTAGPVAEVQEAEETARGMRGQEGDGGSCVRVLVGRGWVGSRRRDALLRAWQNSAI